MRMINPGHRKSALAGFRVDAEVVGRIELVAGVSTLKVEIPRPFGLADSAEARGSVHLTE